MSRFSLSSYTLRVTDEDGTNLNVDDFGDGRGLLEILQQFFNELTNELSHDEENKKLLRVSRLERQDRTLKGIIETGEYGIESTLYDVEKAEVSYQRHVNEAEMLPFYYVLKVPEGADECVLLLQRFKQFGIRTILTECLQTYFSREYPGFRLSINPLVPEQTVKEVIKRGKIMKVRLVRFTIPADIADAYDNGGHVEDASGHVELAVIAKRKGGLPIVERLSEILGGKRDITRLIELRGFNYDTVKVEVNISGIRRTIDLSHLNKFRAYFDISDQVKIGPNGHPSFESLDEAAGNLIHDLGQALGTEGLDV